MALFAPTASRPTRRTLLSGVLAVLLTLASLTFVACGDDGKVLGSDGGAGSTSGGSAGGAGYGSAGNGHAGTQTNAGSSSGGSASNGGSGSNGGNAGGSNGGNAGSSNGGTASCNIGECVRANVCLDHCGGNVVYSGCCPCAANTVEQLSCDNAGGQGSGGQGSGGQGSADCVGATCKASQTCVAYRTVGGAIFPPDTQGMCMTGKHVEGDSCLADFAYTCAELTGCAAPSNTCRCAANTACANTTVCRLPTASIWLDTSADLVCEFQAP